MDIHTQVVLLIQQLMDICVLSEFLLLWIKYIHVKYIFTYKSLHRHIFSFLLGMEWLGHMVSRILRMMPTTLSLVQSPPLWLKGEISLPGLLPEWKERLSDRASSNHMSPLKGSSIKGSQGDGKHRRIQWVLPFCLKMEGPQGGLWVTLRSWEVPPADNQQGKFHPEISIYTIMHAVKS